MYRYETHCHTSPVSACASASPEETVRAYKELGFDGIFISNHFLDGNCAADRSLSWKEQLDFYFSDYRLALSFGEKYKLKVFLGVELSYKGTDFLIYGLKESWYYEHPEIMQMDKRTELALMKKDGALVIHAHPYREANYIDHIRLYPDSVEGVEVINANRRELENRMARIYAENYGFLMTAGSDNHSADRQKKLAGVMCEEPFVCEEDYIRLLREGKVGIFTADLNVSQDFKAE